MGPNGLLGIPGPQGSPGAPGLTGEQGKPGEAGDKVTMRSSKELLSLCVRVRNRLANYGKYGDKFLQATQCQK